MRVNKFSIGHIYKTKKKGLSTIKSPLQIFLYLGYIKITIKSWENRLDWLDDSSLH